MSVIRFLVLSIAVLSAFPATSQERKKVAVVLSGGGAKGFAHIGALKVIERAGIPVDYVVGTSMGAIVGGLYSIGYDAQTLDSLVRRQDWKYLLSDQIDSRNQSINEKAKQSTYLFSRPILHGKENTNNGGLVSGHNLANLFSRLTVGYHDSIDFDNLPIPYACIATDMVDYSEVVIREGWLSTAMRASMSIPGVFTPVRIDSMVLVDGGLKNNYPVDVARSMGADVVIGVTLSKDRMGASELKFSSDIISQLLDFTTNNKYEENTAATDVLIHVNVDGYTPASFNPKAVDSLLVRGEAAAEAQWEKLLALKKAIGLPDGYRPGKVMRYADGFLPQKVYLAAVDMHNVGEADRNYLVKKYKIRENDSISSLQLEQAMTALRSDLMYSSAEYSLRQMAGGYWLTIEAGPKQLTQVNLGVRFDTEEFVALQANTEFLLPMRLPVKVSATGRLGKRYMGRLAATFMPARINNWTLAYTFRRNDINVYREGERDFNITYNYHSLDLTLLRLSGSNFSFDLGAKWENFNFENMLVDRSQTWVQLRDEHLYSFYARVYFNSENKEYFTTKGGKFDAGYTISTENFTDYRGHVPIQAVNALWRVAFSPSRRFTIQPSVAGRLVWGKELPWCLGNFAGGGFVGHWLDQQLPFAGIDNIELMGNAFVTCGLKLQQRIMDNNYAVVRASAGASADLMRNLWENGVIHGYEASWAYDSFFGPVSASCGWSSRSKSLYFYLNLGYTF